ncbi:ribonuclease-like [Sphaerodactylus townsendi]|uniref:ribonuclease-like n=1 Tax=Sphaerodactylus townsendi TaxID=933632 RepID=UPI002026B156|nr:ribonuclease-like [Sphaerodactylus townsendi]
MTPKISFWLLLRLAVLLAAFLLQSSEGSRYRHFQRQHVDHPRTGAANDNAYCNLMMRRRGLTRGRCKPTNTFIHSSLNTIRSVCQGRRNLCDSRQSFSMTVCRNRGRYPRCNYVGRRHNRRMRLGCRNGVPVHFDRML